MDKNKGEFLDRLSRASGMKDSDFENLDAEPASPVSQTKPVASPVPAVDTQTNWEAKAKSATAEQSSDKQTLQIQRTLF